MNLTRVLNKFVSFCFFFFKLKHIKLAYLFAFYKLPKRWASNLHLNHGKLVFKNTGNAIFLAQLDQFGFSVHFLIELLSNPLFKVKETTIDYFVVEVEGLTFKVASLSNMAVLYEIFIEKIYSIDTTEKELVVIDIGMNVGVASLFFASQSYVNKVTDPKVAAKRGNTQKGVPKSIKAIGGVTKAIGKQNFAARLASAASRNF